MENRQPGLSPHLIQMKERQNLQITGVTDVESFDEQMVVLNTSAGGLTIKGDNLRISRIDVEAGDLSLEGEIDELVYGSWQEQSGGFWSRLFR